MNKKLGFVVSEFNADITKLMETVGKEHAEFLGIQVERTIKVPGAFDIPLAVKNLLKDKDIGAVVTLGTVIQGDTEHDVVVAQHASRKIMDLSLEFDKPVSLGISGPKISRAESIARIEEYSKRAVETAVKMLRRIT
ncbi:6,7-dimethyl-8-ribityllumazine synthase [Candidatus Woesearchaeota archaeon]|nr:6,7-dimethyl-8-ribityllumazine synthase [Candidatus Woesearchaeota archaeon]